MHPRGGSTQCCWLGYRGSVLFDFLRFWVLRRVVRAGFRGRTSERNRSCWGLREFPGCTSRLSQWQTSDNTVQVVDHHPRYSQFISRFTVSNLRVLADGMSVGAGTNTATQRWDYCRAFLGDPRCVNSLFLSFVKGRNTTAVPSTSDFPQLESPTKPPIEYSRP